MPTKRVIRQPRPSPPGHSACTLSHASPHEAHAPLQDDLSVQSGARVLVKQINSFCDRHRFAIRLSLSTASTVSATETIRTIKGSPAAPTPKGYGSIEPFMVQQHDLLYRLWNRGASSILYSSGCSLTRLNSLQSRPVSLERSVVWSACQDLDITGKRGFRDPRVIEAHLSGNAAEEYAVRDDAALSPGHAPGLRHG